MLIVVVTHFLGKRYTDLSTYLLYIEIVMK